jgi:hypothetical protein
MLWLAANWRIAFVLSALALTIGGVAYVQHLQSAASAAKAAEKAAVVQTQVATATTQATDKAHITIEVATAKAERATDAIHAATGSDTPVPPDVLSRWRDGLRDLAASSDGQSAPKPAG